MTFHALHEGAGLSGLRTVMQCHLANKRMCSSDGRLGEWYTACGKTEGVRESDPEVRIISTRFGVQISK